MITSLKSFGSYVLSSPTSLFCDEVAYARDASSEASAEPSSNEDCAIPSAWTALTLIEIKPINYNTSIFRFQLLDSTSRLRLPVGSFLLIKAPGREHDGSDAIRPYTNIEDDSLEENIGFFDILCKRYDEWGVKENTKSNFLFTKTDHSYRPKGADSSYLHGLRVGEKVLFKCIYRLRFE